MRKYGIPYMGSKNSILKNICSIFPKTENFYDIFGGGFSVSHFMIENRFNDYKNFYFNEIRKGVPELIKDAINGKYNYKVYKPEFITRKMFFERKDNDAMVKLLWSFGNNGKSYLFGKDIEKYKESLHNAVVFNSFDKVAIDIFGFNNFKDGYSIKDKRLFLRNVIKAKYPNKKRGELERLQQLQQLERLQQLQQLQQLQRLVNLTSLDYRKIKIKENSIIYCDPPYIGTGGYDNEFNHNDFYNWVENQNNPVFISEYTMPKNRDLYLISSFKKRSIMAAKKTNDIKIEKVFGNKLALIASRKA